MEYVILFLHVFIIYFILIFLNTLKTHIKLLLSYLRDYRNPVLFSRHLEDKLKTLAQHLTNYIVECDNRTGRNCTFRFKFDSNEAIDLDNIIMVAAE